MSGVDYLAPASIVDAVTALRASAGSARLMAGGTDLLVQMRGGRAKPLVVIDLKDSSALAASAAGS